MQLLKQIYVDYKEHNVFLMIISLSYFYFLSTESLLDHFYGQHINLVKK